MFLFLFFLVLTIAYHKILGHRRLVIAKFLKLREIRTMGEETIGIKIWILESRNMSGKWLNKHKNDSLSSCGER